MNKSFIKLTKFDLFLLIWNLMFTGLDLANGYYGFAAFSIFATIVLLVSCLLVNE